MRWLPWVASMAVACSAAMAEAQPAHPAMRYSCMSDPPPGEPLPWVGEGVPYAIEVLHPGYTIHRYAGFEVPGVRLFQIVGGRRSETADDRYTQVEGIDEAGVVLTDRAMFLRAAAGVGSADALAVRAMAILLRRADARPLVAGSADISERVRDRIVRPAVIDGVLTFWIRVASDSPYATEITVELATGIARGDGG
jgi:hypothetical protein